MILDSGFFILAERNPSRCAALLKRLPNEVLRTNEAVLAQVWRNPKTQVAITRILDGENIEVETLSDGKAIGVLLSQTKQSDVVDASIALMSLTLNEVVLTSDPQDLQNYGVAFVEI